MAPIRNKWLSATAQVAIDVTATSDREATYQSLAMALMTALRLRSCPGMYVFCNDPVAFYEQVTARGIEANEPFVGNGTHVVQMTDPDGYQIAFENPTDEPDTE